MFDGQMELSFGNGRERQPANRRPGRPSRARWWFERMRRVVDRACDWPPPRPEQIWLADARPQAQGQGEPKADERQMCE